MNRTLVVILCAILMLGCATERPPKTLYGSTSSPKYTEALPAGMVAGVMFSNAPRQCPTKFYKIMLYAAGGMLIGEWASCEFPRQDAGSIRFKEASSGREVLVTGTVIIEEKGVVGEKKDAGGEKKDITNPVPKSPLTDSATANVDKKDGLVE